MGKIYKLGNVAFGDPLAKELWVLQINLRSLEYIYKKTAGTLESSEREHLNSVIKSMKASEKRILKQLQKNGYIKTPS